MKLNTISAVGLVTVVAVAVAALAIGVPMPFLAGVIAKRFETATGYRLLMAGYPTVRLLPTMSVSLDGISVVDGGGTRPRTRLEADSVHIKAPLSSIFSARPNLTEVAIVRPVLHVPVLPEQAPSPSGAANPTGGASAPPDGPTVEHLVVTDGAVQFSNQADIEGHISGVALNASLAGDRTLEIRASGRFGEQTVSAGAKGKLPGARDAPGSAFGFTFEAPGLLQGTVTGTAQVRLSGSTLAFNSLSGTIGRASLNGWGAFDFAGKPVIKMGIGIQRLALGAAKADAADAAKGPDQPWSDSAVALEWLNFFDAEVQVAANELSIGRFRLAPASVGIMLDKGVLTAELTQAVAYGGQAQGLAVVNAAGGVPTHTLRVDLIGVQALPLLEDTASFSALDGRVRARIDLRGRGASPRAIMSSLGGAVDILIQDGEIRGVNIEKMVRSVAAHVLTGWQNETADKTGVTQLSAFFRLEDGQALTDNLRLLGPLVRMTGAGAADLDGKTLRFWVEPKLALSGAGQGAAEPVGIGVPIAVHGSWSAPRIYPDIAGIQTSPEAAYAKLRELDTGLFGSAQAKPARP